MIKRKDGAYIDYDTLLELLRECKTTLSLIGGEDKLKSAKKRAQELYNRLDSIIKDVD